MPKRVNEDPQEDGATPAPALRLSENFQSSSADIELRSTDGVRFLVHKANLAVSSTVFADMFDTASHDTGAQLPIVELQENAEILERLLPYCYPSVSPVWEFDAAKDLEFLRAVDKYMIPRIIEIGRAHMLGLLQATPGARVHRPDFRRAFNAFAFARMFQLEDLTRDAFTHLLKSLNQYPHDALGWILQPSNRAARILPLADCQQLAAFLGLLALQNTIQSMSTAEYSLKIVSNTVNVPCDKTKPPADGPREEDYVHSLGRAAVQMWQDERRPPISVLIEQLPQYDLENSVADIVPTSWR